MDIRPQEIEYKKNIGTVDGHPVIELGLKGGYHIVCALRGPHVDYLGVGPHRAVARYMAKKRNSHVQITEMSKSEDLDPSLFQSILPKWERVLEAFRKFSPSRG